MRALTLLLLVAVAGCQGQAPEAPATSSDPKPAKADERFVGLWNQRFELRKDDDRDDAEMKLHLRMTEMRTATFRFNEDATFLNKTLGFENQGTWSADGDTLKLNVTSGPAVSITGGPYEFELRLAEDGSLQGEEMDYVWHLTRIEE